MKDRAFAKINLCLDVASVREDGYHELHMIMAPVDFYDVLEMNIADETSISLNRTFLPVNDKNTVIKAINVMKETYGLTENFACNLTKHIPTQAGLAGGSADAASAIRMITKLCHLNLTREELIEVGKKVGADVPFCIFNEPAYVNGIGEQLEPFKINTDFNILLVKPKRGVSTSAAFNRLDMSKTIHPDCLKMRKALENDDYLTVVDCLGNSLEKVSYRLCPEIREIKEDLKYFGFDGVLMSGSGSTVFGITRKKDLVNRIGNVMRSKGYFIRGVHLYDAQKEETR